MNDINIVFSDFFGGFVPEIEGKKFYVVGQNKEDVQNALNNEKHLVSAIWEKKEADDNHGLLYFMCGFNADAQKKEEERFKDFYNVSVF